LSPNESLPPNFSYRFPADLKHVVSHTTIRVLEGGNVPPKLTRQFTELKALDKEAAREMETDSETSETKFYRQILRRPVIKKDQQIEAQRHFEKPTLDISLTHVRLLTMTFLLMPYFLIQIFVCLHQQIPVYSHLRIHPTVAINLPRSIPKCLETNNLPNLQYCYLEPEETKSE
jgi:hypothetical protein